MDSCLSSPGRKRSWLKGKHAESQNAAVRAAGADALHRHRHDLENLEAPRNLRADRRLGQLRRRLAREGAWAAAAASHSDARCAVGAGREARLLLRAAHLHADAAGADVGAVPDPHGAAARHHPELAEEVRAPRAAAGVFGAALCFSNANATRAPAAACPPRSTPSPTRSRAAATPPRWSARCAT